MEKSLKFGFEELKVWQRAMDLADEVINVIENLKTNRKHYRLIEDLETAVVSVASNIAEGKGRYSKKGFIHFLYVSRSSLYEVITILEVFRRRNWITDIQLKNVKKLGDEVGKMISGLVKSIKNSMS